MAKNILGFIRNIFKRDNFKAEDGPADPVRSNYVSNTDSSLSSLLGLNSSNIISGGMNPHGYSAMDDLLSRYADYENMDDFGELSNALDIVADESCQEDNVSKKIIHASSKDTRIEEIINDCFSTIDIDDHIWEICRTVCKYGSDFEEHIVSESDGLVGIKFLPPPQVRRIDDKMGSLVGFVYDRRGNFSVSTDEFLRRLSDKKYNQQEYFNNDFATNCYEDWEVTHFRMRARHRDSVYGYGILDSARYIMKRLMLLEDAALLYKITRAPQRFAFNVDVGDIPPNEVRKYLSDVKDALKKEKVLDTSTGKIDLMAGLVNSQEDFFIPTRKDKPSMTIDTIGGFDAGFYMDDLQYFKDKLYATVKVPKDYLNYTEDSVSKANLSTLDIRFSRTVLRVQKELKKGVKNMARVHLAAIGYDPDLIDFDITMPSPSSIFEQTLLEVKNLQLDIADKYRAFVSDEWILKNILKFNDEDIRDFKKESDGGGSNPFQESRFPTIESRQMNKEVKKMMDDLGEVALKNDKALGQRVKELQGLAEDIKSNLRTIRGFVSKK